MKSVLNAKPPLTASAYFASLRLCVKHTYTFYMFYTAIHTHLHVLHVLHGYHLLFSCISWLTISASFAFFAATGI